MDFVEFGSLRNRSQFAIDTQSSTKEVAWLMSIQSLDRSQDQSK